MTEFTDSAGRGRPLSVLALLSAAASLLLVAVLVSAARAWPDDPRSTRPSGAGGPPPDPAARRETGAARSPAACWRFVSVGGDAGPPAYGELVYYRDPVEPTSEVYRLMPPGGRPRRSQVRKALDALAG